MPLLNLSILGFLFTTVNHCLLEMLDYLIQDNNLKGVLLREGITDKDILFIKESIEGFIGPTTGLPLKPETF